MPTYPSFCQIVAVSVWFWANCTTTLADPATLARTVFKKHCADCHGAFGSNEGGFDDVLNFESLVGTRVVAGRPEESRLFKRLADGTMPPPDDVAVMPTDDEIAAVRNWIESLATATTESEVPQEATPRTELTRPFVSIEQELASTVEYLKGLPKPDRSFIRFFSLRHLSNLPADVVETSDLRVYRAAVSKLVNSLTWAAEPVVPEVIGEQQTILAVDVRSLQWADSNRWQEILKVYPYGVTYDESELGETITDVAEDLYRLSDSRMPIVRADWFVATASLPALYHTLLELPENAKTLERMLDVDVAANIRNGRAVRAGFTKSGVSGHNRMVERHPAKFGFYWKSYDFKSSAGRGNLFVFSLGPEFEDHPFPRLAFVHDGGEIIFSLPNGLQAYMLVDGKDNRIDAGPVEVVSDPGKTSGTALIVNGLSCMKCHQHGMIEFADTVRESHILRGKERDLTEQLYIPREKMDALVGRGELIGVDQRRFLRTLEDVTGPFLKVGENADKDIRDFPEPVSQIAKWYLRQEITPETAAMELGLRRIEDLTGLLKNSNRLQRLGLHPLAVGETIKREVWEDTSFVFSPFQKVSQELKLGTPEQFR